MCTDSFRLSWAGVFFVFIILSPCIFAQSSPELSQDTFGKALIESCESDDWIEVEALVKGHRLWVKPVVETLINESIQCRLDRDKQGSLRKQEHAAGIAETFERIYGEKSLTIAVNYVNAWTDQQKKNKLVADSLNALGTRLRGAKATRDQALQAYQDALQAYRKIGDRRGEGDVLGGIGFVNWYRGDKDNALASFLEALRIRMVVDDRRLIGNSYSDIGSVYYVFFKEYNKAIENFQKSLVVRKVIGDMENVAKTLPRLAIAYERLGELGKALSAYQQAAEVSRSLNHKGWAATAMYNAGIVLKEMGRYIKALDCLNDALALHRELGDQKRTGETLNVMANIYRKVGDYETSLRYHQEYVEMMKTLGDEQGVATGTMNLGILYKTLGRETRAIELYEAALALFIKLENDEGILNALTNLGSTYQEMGNLEMSEMYLRQALEKSQTLKYKEAVTINMNNLANTLNFENKLDEALTLLEQALPMAEDLGKPELSVATLLSSGDNYERRGALDEAMDYYNRALKLVEQQRISLNRDEFKIGYFSQQRYIYESIVHLLGKMTSEDTAADYAAQAFHIAEQSKARALLDLLTEARPDTGIAALPVTEPVTLKQVQTQILDKKTVMLSYFLGDSSSSLWAISYNKYRQYILPNRDFLQNQIEVLRYALENPKETQIEFFIESSHKLYQALVQPAEEFIGKNTRLIIAPDGVLHLLPFEVLLREEPGNAKRASYADLPYLIKRNPVGYGQSASILVNVMQRRQQKKPRAARTLFAMGDPVFEAAIDSAVRQGPATLSGGTSYERLKFSGNEIRSIGVLFPESNTTILLREKATEENLKAAPALKTADYIHLATHGLINERNPEFSGLLFPQTTASGEDGFLQTDEICKFDLHADLIVLSACETGLGKMIRGEGVIGLTRAFMFAGSPSVVVSLWKVSDASTAVLMKRLYSELIKKNRDKVEAFRLAKLALMKHESYSHPFYWAPFILTGNWE